VQTDENQSKALRVAFVQGAKWWESLKSGGTMSQSDQALAVKEAERASRASITEVADGVFMPKIPIRHVFPLPKVEKAPN